jgi:hypothetical protein
VAEQGPDLSGRDVAKVNLVGSRVRGIWLANAKVTGAWFENASIEGDFEGLTMNGVEVAPLIEAELRKRHPLLAKNNARSAPALRDCVDEVYATWDALEAQARTLDEAKLHALVDDEWSFTETLRHLIYATDAWFRHGVLDDPAAYHPLALSHDEARGEDPGIDLDAAPTYAEVLAVRRANQEQLRAFLAALPDDDVGRPCTPTHSGHPRGTFTVGQAISVIVNEEFWHATYATRDLNALTAG